MPKDLIEISDNIFENTKDVTGKKHIYNDKKYLLYWVLYNMTNQAVSHSSLISKEKQTEMVTVRLPEVLMKPGRIGEGESAQYVEDHEKIPKIANFDFQSYIKDEDIEWAREQIKDVQKIFLDIAEKVEEPELKEYYRGYASICDMTKGNIARALEENGYLSSLFSNTITGLKHNANMPLEQAIKGLKGTHPSMANLPANRKKDIFNDFLTVQNSFAGELEAEYIRQDIERGNWKNQDKIQSYIEKVRLEHQKAIAAFENLIQVNDAEQYDGFLDNSLNHMTERYPGGGRRGAVRGVTAAIHTMKAELRALDNGWGPRDMGLLGALGGIEGGIDKYRSQYQKKNDENKLNELNKAADEFNTLKEKWWNKKNPTAEEKLAFADELKGFVYKYSYSSAISAANISFPRFDATVEKVKSDLNKEKDTSAVREAQEAEFDKMTVYYEALSRTFDRTKGIYDKVTNLLKDNEAIRGWKIYNSPEQGYYNQLLSDLRVFNKKDLNRTPASINKALVSLKENAELLLDYHPDEEDDNDYETVKNICEQLITIADECAKDIADNYKCSVPLSVNIQRSIDIMTKSGVGRAAVYTSTGLKETDNENNSFAAEFEIVSDEEIHAAKIATIDQKIFESDPENMAKIEANAKRNLEERIAREKKAKEKSKSKSRISIRDLEIEDNPDKADVKTTEKVQGRSSISNEKSK